ncbi:hypothetical protein [Stenotrophomonas sp.]|uniref:hypothetical protein n=1 Tax=Stenotrophomonas sp. TaxID=69392 RepID=UPI0028AFCDA1|nr:hypothetical protein [Stenotrophomonas sp.]
MMRGCSTRNPTVAQRQRMDAIKEIGCIVAYALGLSFGENPVQEEVHHPTLGGKHGQKRRGLSVVLLGTDDE